jgi:hypothetical protein
VAERWYDTGWEEGPFTLKEVDEMKTIWKILKSVFWVIHNFLAAIGFFVVLIIVLVFAFYSPEERANIGEKAYQKVRSARLDISNQPVLETGVSTNKNQQLIIAKNKEDALKEFKERVIGSELLNELIPSYEERRKIVNSKMTIEQVFDKYCGEARIEWTILSPEELEKSDMGVAMGNAFKLMLSMSDKETLEKTRQEINEKKYDSEVYGIKVEVTKTYPVDRQKPEIRNYKEGFLFDRRDKKIKRLLLGLMNGISAIDFSIEAKGKKDWK